MNPRFAVLIDLSGTLFIDDVSIPGAIESLRRLLSHRSFAVRFVTNTTKESSSNLLARLHRVGFDFVQKESVFTSITAARQLVQEKGLRPMLLLEKEAEEEFEGIECSDPNAVVIGLAPSQFYYQRLNEAFRLLRDKEESILVGIHKGRYYEAKDGLALGPGPFIHALEYATGKQAVVVGKPKREFFEGALMTIKSSSGDGGCIPISNTVMIGDDVKDDVCGAASNGIRAILVKTGKYRVGDEEMMKNLGGKVEVAENVVEAIERITKDDGIDFFAH